MKSIESIARRKEAPIKNKHIRKVLARLGLGALALGGLGFGGYQAYQHDMIPGIERSVSVSSFDSEKLDTGRQVVVFGQNALEATYEKMKEIINAPLPQMNSNPKTISELPKMSVVPSLDLEKAGKVDIWRKASGTGLLIGNETVSGVPVFFHMSIEKLDTPVGIIVPKGINVDDVEIFKMQNSRGITGVMEKFVLGNDKYIFIELHGNFEATESIINAPIINTSQRPKSGINYLYDALQETGLKLKLLENQTILKTQKNKEESSQSEITIDADYIDGTTGIAITMTPQVENGNLLFSVPR